MGGNRKSCKNIGRKEKHSSGTLQVQKKTGHSENRFRGGDRGKGEVDAPRKGRVTPGKWGPKVQKRKSRRRKEGKRGRRLIETESSPGALKGGALTAIPKSKRSIDREKKKGLGERKEVVEGVV